MGAIMALHSLLITLRIMLTVNLSMVKMYANTEKNNPEITRGIVSKAKNVTVKGTQKVAKGVTNKAVSAAKKAGTIEMRAAALFMEQTIKHSDGSIKLLRYAILMVDGLLACLILFDLLIIALVIALILMLIAAVATILQGLGIASGPSDAGGDAPVSVTAPANNKSDSPTSKVTGSLLGTTAVPAGMDPATWNTASDNGKRIASTALITQNIPFPGSPANDKNNGHMYYNQGTNVIGWYDCNSYASGIYESLGFTEGHGPRKGAPYDFRTMHRGQLQGWLPTASATVYLNKNVGNKGTAHKGMDVSILKPGDVLIGGGHAMIYVGKNTKGQPLVSHAIRARNTMYQDPLMTKKTSQVGLTTLDYILPSMTRKGTVYIYRSDDLINAK